MNFFEASLEINNLGGYCATGEICRDESQDDVYLLLDTKLPMWVRQGYDKTQEILYYSNIGTLRVPSTCVAGDCIPEKLKVDLKVEVVADNEGGLGYRANKAEYLNGFGKGGHFGQINMGGRAGDDFTTDNPTSNDATLKFTLMDQRTREPLADGQVKFFSFSYFDFDKESPGGGGQECLELLPTENPTPSNPNPILAPESYDYERGNSVSRSKEVSGKFTKFCATNVGSKFDNPAAPGDIDEKNLTTYRPEVHNQAVTFEFRDTHVMKVKYSVQCCIDTGRNFVFAGAPVPLE
eukprot:scaffold31120_cov39-Phaeocystis_antarctica.AAC.1